MTRCRSRSFYLAPGVYRAFADTALFTRHPDSGALLEITHRNDVTELEATGGWDHVCFTVPRSIASDFTTTPLDHANAVGVWRLDSRTIEGKRPRDGGWVAHKVAFKGTAGMGGTQTVVDDLFSTSPAPVRSALVRALDDLASPASQSELLRYALTVLPSLSAVSAEKLVEHLTYDNSKLPPLHWDPAAPVSVTWPAKFETETQIAVLADAWRSEHTERVRLHIGALAIAGSPNHRQLPTDVPVHLMVDAIATFDSDVLALDLSPEVAAALAANPKTAPMVALHPDAPLDAVTIFADRDALLSGEFEFPAVPISPERADALAEILTMERIRRPHSPHAAAVVAAGAAHILAARPSRDAEKLFAAAFAQALKAPNGPHHHRALAVLESCDVQISETAIASLWKSTSTWVTAHESGTLDPWLESAACFMSNQDKLPAGVATKLEALLPDYLLPRPSGKGVVGAHAWIRLINETDAVGVADAVESYAETLSSDNRALSWGILDGILAGTLRPEVADAFADALDAKYHRRAGGASEDVVRATESHGANALLVGRDDLRIATNWVRGRGEPVAVKELLDRWRIEEESVAVTAADYWQGEQLDEIVDMLHDRFSDPSTLAAVAAGGHQPKPARRASDLQRAVLRPEAALLRDDVTWPAAPTSIRQVPVSTWTPWQVDPCIAALDGAEVPVGDGTCEAMVVTEPAALAENANELGMWMLSQLGRQRDGDRAVVVLREGNGRASHYVELSQDRTEPGRWEVSVVSNRAGDSMSTKEWKSIAAAVIRLLPKSARARPEDRSD